MLHACDVFQSASVVHQPIMCHPATSHSPPLGSPDCPIGTERESRSKKVRHQLNPKGASCSPKTCSVESHWTCRQIARLKPVAEPICAVCLTGQKVQRLFALCVLTKKVDHMQYCLCLDSHFALQRAIAPGQDAAAEEAYPFVCSPSVLPSRLLL